MVDAQNLVVPLWGAIVAACGAIATVVGVVAWVFVTFATKTDQKERHDDHEGRISKLEENWGEIKSDLSYIRGRLEPKP